MLMAAAVRWCGLVSISLIGAGAAGGSAEQAAATPRPDFLGKAWISTDPAAAAGSLRMFLPDGTLLMDSCLETYRLARWRTIDGGRIEWQEDGARIQAEVTQPARDRLRLRLQLGRETREENYRLARVPFTCPDTRVGPEDHLVHFEGRLLFLGRLPLPASAAVRVELRDSSRADAPARTLARQTFTAKQGPPFAFSLAVPASVIDAHARLSLFADIRDGRRLLFVADSANAVPIEGAKGMELRLGFVPGGTGNQAGAGVTPSPGTYRCAAETFRIAFEEMRAYVTLPDGSVVTLQRQMRSGKPGQSRTFSNGRLTFVQEGEGSGESRVLFARGRMLPSPCTKQ